MSSLSDPIYNVSKSSILNKNLFVPITFQFTIQVKIQTCTLGWSDFEEKKCYTLYVVPNCCWTPIPKFHVLMLPLSLVARPLKILAVTLKSTQIQFLKPATGGNVFFDFWKVKNEVKFKKKFILTLYRSKTVLLIFGD